MLLRRWIFEFRIELIQNGGGIVNIFISVSPLDRPWSALSLPIHYECLPTLANAFANVAIVTNALPTLPILGKWRMTSSQHSLKFRNRFLNWPIFISIFASIFATWKQQKLTDHRKEVGMTCERTEFVTNYYKDTVNVAKFERLLNVSVRKHIR